MNTHWCIISMCMVIILVTLIVDQYLYMSYESFQQAPKVQSTVPQTNTNLCSPLLDAMKNDLTLQSVMQNKLSKVKNDGEHFRYFNDTNKVFDNASDYCYISTFDYSKQGGAPACSKTTPVYNFAMIKDVTMGAVMEKGDKFPKQVCMMKLDKSSVGEGDVRQFSNLVSNFDDKLMVSRIDECQNNLSERTQRYNMLLDEHKQLQEQYKQLMVTQEQCSNQSKSYIHQNTLLNAAMQAVNGKIVIVDARNVQNQITINTRIGMTSIPISDNFVIGYIHVPPSYKVKIIRKDGGFNIFDRSSPEYPSVQKTYGENVDKIEVIQV